MTAPTLAAARQARIKAICAMQRQLGMDEDTLRAMFREVTGKSSRKDMTLPELTAVRDRLVQAGAKLTAPGGGGRALAADEPAKKLRALWLRGVALGILRDPSESALASWASNSRSPNVTALLHSFGPADWTAAIEQLKKWLTREVRSGMVVCEEGHRYDLATRSGATGRIMTSHALWGQVMTCPACQAMDRESLLRWRRSDIVPAASTTADSDTAKDRP